MQDLGRQSVCEKYSSNGVSEKKKKEEKVIVNFWLYISSSEATECDTFGNLWLNKTIKVWNYRNIHRPTTHHKFIFFSPPKET